ncbi:MAG: glucose-1-phosphate adenylyltransferase, partial [Acidimicrobiia bacterium]|nr:glucose-1-phosphate adenylyltransferase [Acidimicrobiia bacterium]
GSIDAYHEAHMDLVSVNPIFNLYNQDWPIYTSDMTAPPAKVVAVAEFGSGQVADSMLSAGAVISGAFVRGSVLSPWVRVEPGATIDNSVILEGVVVEPGARIKNAIIDKGVTVPAGYEIGYDAEEDRSRGFVVTEGGIVTVPKNEVLS